MNSLRKLKIIGSLFLCLSLCLSVYAGMHFDGSNAEVYFGDIPEIDDATALTVGCWVNQDNITQDHWIFGQRNQYYPGFELICDDSGVGSRLNTYTISVDDGTSADITGATGAAVAGVWTHVAFTFEAGSATGLRLYVNGVEDANSPVDASAVGNAGSTNSSFHVGQSVVGQRDMLGSIDELRVWNKVFTADQIKQLAKSRVRYVPLQIESDNLQLYVPFDDGIGGESADATNPKDLSGNSRNGVSSGGTLWVSGEVLSYP